MTHDAKDREKEVKECRICLDEGNSRDMISPCLCKGSNRWVHRACLDHWRATKSNRDAFTHCSTCKFKFKIRDYSSAAREKMKLWRYRFLVGRDLSMVVLLIHLYLLCFAYGLRSIRIDLVSFGDEPSDARLHSRNPDLQHAWDASTGLAAAETDSAGSSSAGVAADSPAGALLSTTGAVDAADGSDVSAGYAKLLVQGTPPPWGLWAYYAGAVLLSLALLGVIMSVLSCLRMLPEDLEHPCGGGRGNHHHNHGRCCDCNCGNCNGCGGGQCTGGGFLLIVLLVFAIIGVAYGVALASMIAQRVVARHCQVVWLKQETKRFFVIDLSKPEEQQDIDQMEEAMGENEGDQLLQ